MGIDVITYALCKRYHDEHSGGQAIMVGTVTNGTTAFPTSRPDGTALVLGDFVKPASGSTYPFTVAGITFKNGNDQAVYAGGTNWLYNANPFQSTADTPLANPSTESISGTAVCQNQVNIEFKAEFDKKVSKSDIDDKQLIYARENGTERTVIYGAGIDLGSGTIPTRTTNGNLNVPETPSADGHAASKKYVDSRHVTAARASFPATGEAGVIYIASDQNKTYRWDGTGYVLIGGGNGDGYVHEQATAASVWAIAHSMGKYPSVTVVDSAGNTCIGGIEYVDADNVKLTFSMAIGGKAYLS